MSLEEVAKQVLVDAGVAAVKAAIGELAHHDKAVVLDEIAERLKFDADGNRKLALRRMHQGG